jgi:hypothetical protein
MGCSGGSVYIRGHAVEERACTYMWDVEGKSCTSEKS